MKDTVSTPTSTFQLEPPEVIAPVALDAAREAVPLKPELQKQVDDQVLRFIDALANEDVQVGARSPSVREAKLLGVASSLPCLEVTRQIVTSAGVPIHHEAALYRGDVYRQRFRLRR